jgi:hypothetical protein
MQKAKQEILKSLKNTYCRLMPSKIQGIGVFAIRDIPKGINPFNKALEQGWQKFKIAELRVLDKEIFKMVEAFFTIQKDNTVYIPKGGLNDINISYFMNDLQNPNVKMAKDEVNFITIRKIKKGEELTVLYETYLEKIFFNKSR